MTIQELLAQAITPASSVAKNAMTLMPNLPAMPAQATKNALSRIPVPGVSQMAKMGGQIAPDIMQALSQMMGGDMPAQLNGLDERMGRVLNQPRHYSNF